MLCLGTTSSTFSAKKYNDESSTTELDQGRELHARDAGAMCDGSTSLLCRPPLFVSEDHEMGVFDKETLELLSHAQIMADIRKTPRAFRIRASILRKYNLVT